MATAPVWSLGTMPFGADYAFNPTSSRVTRAKAVWDNPAGYTNTEWVSLGKAKYGTWDNYLKAIQDYGTAYTNYVIKNAEEAHAANPSPSTLSGLASAYSTAAAFPGFTSSQQSKYSKLATSYQNQYTTEQKSADAAKAERTRLAELKATGNEIAQLIRQQAADRYAPAMESLTATRDKTYKQLNDAYNTDYENITKAYQDGLISEGQRADLRTQAEATFNAARDSLFSQYDAAKAAVQKQFDADYAYATSVASGIASEQLDPNDTYKVSKFTAPTITKGVSYSAVEMPQFEDVPYEKPVEEDPYAGMTLEEKIKAMSANAKASIEASLKASQDAVDAKLAETFGPGRNSAEQLIAEMQQGPEMGTAKEAMDAGMGGFDGMSGDTARNLAQELIIAGNLGAITDPATGQPYEDPLGSLAASIWEKGFDSVYQDLQGQGINFLGAVPEGFITDAAATPIIQQLFQAGEYDPNASGFSQWNDYLQANGLEATLAQWSELGNKGSLTPEQISAFDASVGMDDFYALQKAQFDSNINTILQGADIRPSYGDLSPESAISQAFAAKGISIENNQDQFDSWVDYANTYDVDTALAKLDAQITGLYGNESLADLITQPQEAFTPTGIFQPDLSDLTYSPTQGQYTTEGVYEAPTFAPTGTQVPTGGIPAGTTTTYQPAPYTPPPLISAAPQRPMLSPAQEVIGAPTIERPVGAPMQALTAQEAGGQFNMPTQEDYFAYFGYTPEQLNAAQYLAELEGAPRAGVAAQTVPVIPTAVTGAPAPTGMKEGGSVGGLKAAAQELQAQGRGGDTILAHINPQEAAMLKAMGGSGTINPKTGLREFLFGRGGIDINIGKKSRQILVPIAAAVAAPYLPAIAGSSAVTAGLLAGAGTVLGGGSLQQGLQTGLMAGMGASAAQSMGYQGIPGVQTPTQAAGVAGTGGSAMGAGVGSQNIQYMPSAESQAALYNQPIQALAPPPTESFLSKITPDLSKMDLGDAAMLGYAGVGLAGLKENQQAQADYEAYMAGLDAERRRKKAAGTAAFERAFAAKGGLMKLAGGGMTYAEGGGTTGPTNEPRMVKGTGDGMSDSVPATIEGVQEARLANDEFVIPADVVADLGNGSSSAGAQQLYDMMDRVRKARHGTTEQPPEIDVRKIMPA